MKCFWTILLLLTIFSIEKNCFGVRSRIGPIVQNSESGEIIGGLGEKITVDVLFDDEKHNVIKRMTHEGKPCVYEGSTNKTWNHENCCFYKIPRNNPGYNLSDLSYMLEKDIADKGIYFEGQNEAAAYREMVKALIYQKANKPEIWNIYYKYFHNDFGQKICNDTIATGLLYLGLVGGLVGSLTNMYCRKKKDLSKTKKRVAQFLFVVGYSLPILWAVHFLATYYEIGMLKELQII